MSHFGPFSTIVSLRCLDTHTYEHKYTLKCVRRSKPFVSSVTQKSFFDTSLYTMGRGVARRDLTHITPKVKLCMHTMY